MRFMTHRATVITVSIRKMARRGFSSMTGTAYEPQLSPATIDWKRVSVVCSTVLYLGPVRR